MRDLSNYLPILGSVLGATFVALIFPALRLPRILRKDLVVDAQFLESIDEPARAELRADMTERSVHLVAFSRFPSITRTEIVGLVAIAGLGALSVVNGLAIPSVKNYFDGEAHGLSLMCFFFQAVILAVSLRGWPDRTIGRLEYTRDRLRPDAYAEFRGSTGITVGFCKIVLLGTLAGPAVFSLVCALRAADGFDLSSKVFAGVAIVFVIGFCAESIYLIRTPALSACLPSFQPALQTLLMGVERTAGDAEGATVSSGSEATSSSVERDK
jgi:hypothetical protein